MKRSHDGSDISAEPKRRKLDPTVSSEVEELAASTIEEKMYGYSSIQGMKPTQEDVVVGPLDLRGLGTYYAVFDGHCGNACSDFLGHRLHLMISDKFYKAKKRWLQVRVKHGKPEDNQEIIMDEHDDSCKESVTTTSFVVFDRKQQLEEQLTACCSERDVIMALLLEEPGNIELIEAQLQVEQAMLELLSGIQELTETSPTKETSAQAASPRGRRTSRSPRSGSSSSSSSRSRSASRSSSRSKSKSRSRSKERNADATTEANQNVPFPPGYVPPTAEQIESQDNPKDIHVAVNSATSSPPVIASPNEAPTSQSSRKEEESSQEESSTQWNEMTVSAITAGCEEADAEFLKIAHTRNIKAGSTGLMLFIQNFKGTVTLYVANIGDSRAVMSRYL